MKALSMFVSPSIGQRYATIASYTGGILVILGMLVLTPLIALPFFPGEVSIAGGFLIPAASLVLSGLFLRRIFHRKTYISLNVQEGGVIVLFSWLAAFIGSAVPYMLILKTPFHLAVFESVSGWTTTGLSIVDVAKAPNLVLLWRSITQLAGGAGLAIVMISSLAGPAGAGFSIAEGRGDQLLPNVRASAKLVLTIYAGYAAAGALGYIVLGMIPFDAVNHTFAAISTGGFSTHPESIAYWNSVPIEAVSIVLMILGNFNFLTAYILFKGRFSAFARNGEVRVLFFLILVGACLLFLFVTPALYSHLDKCVRVSVFESVSALTTTGFSTVGYGSWNAVGIFVLILLMFVGGGTGSTAGGIKQLRVYLLYKAFVWEIRRSLLPRNAVVEYSIWQGEHRIFVSDSLVRQTGIFLFFYLFMYAVGVLVLAAYGYGLKESLFEFASALANAGLSVGLTSPSCPEPAIWTETVGMALGRLEFFIVFTAVGKMIRDIRKVRQ
jgi:trk system potassium uptake protein TrkH